VFPFHKYSGFCGRSLVQILIDDLKQHAFLGSLQSVANMLYINVLYSSNVVIDKQTCHKQIKVTSEGRGLCLSSEDRCIPNDPLRFDQLYCALGSVAIKSGQHYWEVDVHCCSSWAVGMAYGSLQRRGRDKGAKLGRNRSSWSLEFQDGHLTAWHNDRHVALPVTAARAAPNRVGVFVKYQKGRLFSAVQTAVFDRAHHQFTEPLYPAFRFFSPKDKGHHHMEICNLSL
uniref:Si:dkey-219e21.4 n=1 Tax=Cyprinus carpio TaxID=7962 RepID=A0A8C1Y269_CYPCA